MKTEKINIKSGQKLTVSVEQHLEIELKKSIDNWNAFQQTVLKVSWMQMSTR